MTIDEAIEEELRRQKEDDERYYVKSKYHKQLAEWLEELKVLRLSSMMTTTKEIVASQVGYEKGYNNAIDDFEDKLLYQIGDLGIRDIIQETAEQLKAGGENDKKRTV